MRPALRVLSRVSRIRANDADRSHPDSDRLSAVWRVIVHGNAARPDDLTARRPGRGLNYVTWTVAGAAPTLGRMGSGSRKVQTALARCDLERVISQYLRDGVSVESMTAELLDICVNLRDLSRTQGAPSAMRAADAREESGARRGTARPASDAGLKLQSLKPVP